MCSVYFPDDSAHFSQLNVEHEVTLQAWAPGYASAEITMIPMRWWHQPLTFELQPIE
jgi:hypothetical protein